jgi:hypothetical protein
MKWVRAVFVATVSLFCLTRWADAGVPGTELLIRLNEVMIRMEPVSRFLENNRLGAIVHLSIHDALNSIPQVKRYHTYIPAPLAGNWSHASPRAAAAAAGFTSMRLYIDELRLPYPQAWTPANAVRASQPITDADYAERRAYLDAWYVETLASIPESTPFQAAAKARGILLGELAGERMFDARKGDGWDVIPATPYPLPLFDNPPANAYTGIFGPYNPFGQFPLGQYTLHYPSFFGLFLPEASRWWWKDITTFAVEDVDDFRGAPPPAPNDPVFLQDLEEVRSIGEANSSLRTEEQTLIAEWWHGCAGTGYGMPNKVAQAMIRREHMDLVDAARVFALMTMAMSDSLFANIAAKTHYNFWRPVTAVNRLHVPATAGDAWIPYLGTPPNQEYPAGHPMLSGGSAMGILGVIFGYGPVPGGIEVSTFPEFDELRPQHETGFPCGFLAAPYNGTRTFPSIHSIVQDVVAARVYGGLHYRGSGKEGVKNGRRLAWWIYTRYLLPL